MKYLYLRRAVMLSIYRRSYSIDFAYRIHTDMATGVWGPKVNGK